MAKLTSQQREYFRDRVNVQFEDTLGPLKKLAASKKAKMVDEKFNDFIDSLGLSEIISKFRTIESEYKSMQQTLSNHLTNLREQYDMNGRAEWSWDKYTDRDYYTQVYDELLKMCRKECEIAFRSIPEGEAIERLKNKQREAIDYIMGYDQQAELLSGLSNVLKGSGVGMLEEYKGA